MSVDSLQKRFIEKNLTLSVAESCTGGALSARLTAIPDASKYFLGGVVAYSNALKEGILLVPPSLIQTAGAVSAETAKAMLAGILHAAKSDWGVAITGIAGPSGGTPEKPVGTVWVAIGNAKEEPDVWNAEAQGTRAEIIEKTVDAVLERLMKHLL